MRASPGVKVAVLAGVAFLAALGSLVVQPRWLARTVARCGTKVLFAAPTRRREVALTFDDGPDARTTPPLLEVLRRHGAHGTFFLIGSRAAESPGLTRRIVEEGHEIGHHMWRDRPSILASRSAFERDFLRTHEVLAEISAVSPSYFRPASGWYSPRMVRAAADMGCRTVLGSVAPRDLSLEDMPRVLAFICKRLQPGCLIVLHEVHPRGEVLANLVDLLLRELKARGLRAVTVSALMR